MEIKSKDLEEFHELCKRLELLMEKIKEYEPGAHYYAMDDALTIAELDREDHTDVFDMHHFPGMDSGGC